MPQEFGSSPNLYPETSYPKPGSKVIWPFVKNSKISCSSSFSQVLSIFLSVLKYPCLTFNVKILHQFYYVGHYEKEISVELSSRLLYLLKFFCLSYNPLLLPVPFWMMPILPPDSPSSAFLQHVFRDFSPPLKMSSMYSYGQRGKIQQWGDYSGSRKEEGDKGGNAGNLNTKTHLRGHMGIPQ